MPTRKPQQQQPPVIKPAEPPPAVAAGYDRQPTTSEGSREADPARPSPGAAAAAPAVHQASYEAQQHGKNPSNHSRDAIAPHGTDAP